MIPGIVRITFNICTRAPGCFMTIFTTTCTSSFEMLGKSSKSMFMHHFLFSRTFEMSFVSRLFTFSTFLLDLCLITMYQYLSFSWLFEVISLSNPDLSNESCTSSRIVSYSSCRLLKAWTKNPCQSLGIKINTIYLSCNALKFLSTIHESIVRIKIW